jgi:DNA end-binding protein Ku
MILETLHYAEEVRKADSYFSDISAKKADEDLLGVAKQLIERKASPFDAAAFKNHYTQALRELIDQRLKGKAPKVESEDERPSGDNVIDLMSALKRSLEGRGADETPGRASSGARKPAAAKSASRSKARSSASPKSRARKSAQKARKSA